jgi:hypothetical protein
MEQQEKNEADVDIEAIMQDIRQQILSQRRVGKGDLPVAGRRFSPAFYEQLYQVGLMQSEIGVTMQVTKSNVPLVGTLIDKVRAKFHQLMLFYAEQVVAQQLPVNEHLLQAVTLLSQELEAEVDQEPLVEGG